MHCANPQILSLGSKDASSRGGGGGGALSQAEGAAVTWVQNTQIEETKT